jgi:hypothetical protein
MPYLGLGIHFLIALFFAVHAVRSGRNIFWVIILFSFPLLGSIVYFFVEYLPDMRNSRAGRAVGKAALNVIDPKRELREARHAFDLSQTNQNRMRLANALLEAGESEEAITHLNACLVGQHEHDPDVLTRLARAHMDMGDAAGTSAALNKLITHHPERNTGDTALMYARALGATIGAERTVIDAAFQHALATGSGAEAKLRYGQSLAGHNNDAAARAQFEAIKQDAKHWTPHAKSLNREWLRDAENALTELAKR